MVLTLMAQMDVLTMLIPELEEIVGTFGGSQRQQEHPFIINRDEARNRFKFAFQRFFKLLPVKSFLFDGPLVLTMDDIQWADDASLDLLEELMSLNISSSTSDRGSSADEDTHTNGFILICCYRSDEVSVSTKAFGKRIQNWKKETETKEQYQGHNHHYDVTELSIGNVTVKNVTSMLMDLLSIDDSSIVLQNLAKIIHQRTHGNPFFVIQYTSMLYQQQLLKFNIGVMKWEWNESDIQSKTKAADNVVDILKHKMNTISSSSKHHFSHVMQLAATLGTTFTKRTISIVHDNYQYLPPPLGGDDNDDDAMKKEEKVDVNNEQDVEKESWDSPRTIEEWLKTAVDQGFLEVNDDDGYGGGGCDESYHWVHDKVKEAAISLASSPEEFKHI